MDLVERGVTTILFVFLCWIMNVYGIRLVHGIRYTYVCVCERERERERNESNTVYGIRYIV